MCNEHSKLSAPVPNMVESHYIMAQELEKSTYALAYDSGPEVAHMHLLGNVGRTEVYYHLLLTPLKRRGLDPLLHQLVQGLFYKGCLEVDVDEPW